MSSSKRPELQAPPEVYYDEVEAGKYLHNSRMIDVQAQMPERALQMLKLPPGRPCLLLVHVDDATLRSALWARRGAAEQRERALLLADRRCRG